MINPDIELRHPNSEIFEALINFTARQRELLQNRRLLHRRKPESDNATAFGFARNSKAVEGAVNSGISEGKDGSRIRRSGLRLSDLCQRVHGTSAAAEETVRARK